MSENEEVLEEAIAEANPEQGTEPEVAVEPAPEPEAGSEDGEESESPAGDVDAAEGDAPNATPASPHGAIKRGSMTKRDLPPRPAPDPVMRQSLSCQGGQCNLRIGPGALESLGREVKAMAGKPRLAFLILSDAVRPKLAKRLRMQLADGEFAVIESEVEAGPAARDFAQVSKLYKRLAKKGITADDVIVAVGDPDVLSLASFVATTWCGGTALVMVATDALACLEPAVTPRSLDVKGLEGAVRVKGHPKMLFCDFDEFDPTSGDAAMMVRAMSVGTAMADNQNSFNRLAGRAEAIADGDVAETRTQMLDCIRSRARMASSAAAAVRQGLGYGKELAGVLARHLPDASPAELLAEGMRFGCRLAISIEESVDVDMVFAQDALLARLGLNEVPCDLDPEQIAVELREECFRRSNRFLLTIPLGFGKVRMTSVPEDVLADHLAAFCAARRALL